MAGAEELPILTVRFFAESTLPHKVDRCHGEGVLGQFVAHISSHGHLAAGQLVADSSSRDEKDTQCVQLKFSLLLRRTVHD
jgi:hypothetical protein